MVYLTIIAGFFLTFTILISPRIGLYFISFMLPVEEAYKIGERTLIVGFLAFTVLGYLIKILRGQMKLKTDKKAIRILLLLFIWMFASSLWSYYPGISISRSILTVQLYLFLLIYTSLCETEEIFDKVLIFYLLSITIHAIAALFGLLSSGTVGRLVAVGNQNPNVFARNLGLAGIIGIYNIFVARNIGKKFLLLLATSVNITALLFTGSRGAWVALLVMVFLYWLIEIILEKKLSFKQVSGIIIIVGLVLTFFLTSELIPAQIRNRLLIFTERGISDTAGRDIIWLTGLNMVKDNIWLGVGHGNFPERYLQYASYMSYGRDAHNIYLAILAELGIVGLVMFGYFLFYLYRIIIKQFNHYKAKLAFSLLTFTLIGGLTATHLYRKYFWFVISIVFITNNLIKKERIMYN